MLIGIDGNEANVRQRVGSNQYAFELLKAFWHLEVDHEWVVYLREKPLIDLPTSRKGWSYRSFGPKRLWTQGRLPLDLYFHNPRPQVFFTPGHYAPRWSSVPTVISIMDLGFLRFREQFTRRDWLQLSNWTAASVKRASRILAISESTKNDIINNYNVSPEKVTVTYPGYDEGRFNLGVTQREVKKVKEKYKIKQGYLLFLSTLKPSKNLEGLLTAYKLIGPAQKLVIAGKKGWLFDSIFEKVSRLGLEERVIFTDFVPDEEVPALMRGADLFLLPSFWEGFGIPVVEAMATGTPVVVSNAGSLPEIVGEAGVIVDPHNPEEIARGIKEALKQRELLVKKGLERVKKFSWKSCAKQTTEVLEELK